MNCTQLLFTTSVPHTDYNESLDKEQNIVYAMVSFTRQNKPY